LQALHDLAVCYAAGLAPACKEGLHALQQQLQQESLDGDTLPAEGEQLGLVYSLHHQLNQITYVQLHHSMTQVDLPHQLKS
jgi:hypothetical protein